MFISIALIQSTHWLFTSPPGSWSISNEWLFSLLLPLIRRITRKQLYLLIGLSWLGQFFSSFIVYKWGGVIETDSQEQYVMKIWVNTLNPIINLAFFLIGIGLKKGFIPILRHKFTAFIIILTGQFLSSVFGIDMLFMWPLILWATFSLCVNWQPESNILKKSVTFIGQRTYGIFFIHFIILRYAQEFIWINALTERFGLRNLILFTITLLASTILAEFSWRFIESPMINFSRKLIRR
jgi:peptidoglycan/LPS O-acetylase OafA/YrhL